LLQHERIYDAAQLQAMRALRIEDDLQDVDTSCDTHPESYKHHVKLCTYFSRLFSHLEWMQELRRIDLASVSSALLQLVLHAFPHLTQLQHFKVTNTWGDCILDTSGLAHAPPSLKSYECDSKYVLFSLQSFSLQPEEGGEAIAAFQSCTRLERLVQSAFIFRETLESDHFFSPLLAVPSVRHLRLGSCVYWSQHVYDLLGKKGSMLTSLQLDECAYEDYPLLLQAIGQMNMLESLCLTDMTAPKDPRRLDMFCQVVLRATRLRHIRFHCSDGGEALDVLCSELLRQTSDLVVLVDLDYIGSCERPRQKLQALTTTFQKRFSFQLT
jgi:hypothetical protein